MVKLNTIYTILFVALFAIIITNSAVLYGLRSYEPVAEGVEYSEYPGIEMAPFEDITPLDTPRDFKVALSYHANKIYEGTEFEVIVTDSDRGTPVVDASVSFMIPAINLQIPKEGFVYFSAPKIQDEYLLHPYDTFCLFPLTVKKEGYNSYTTSVTVHLAP